MERYKYPRTPHLPFTQSTTKDDRILSSIDHFVGQEIVVTEKMDGENCLEGSSLVITPKGERTISDICENQYKDEVLSYDTEKERNEFKQVIGHSIATEQEEWYEIETEKGYKIVVTGRHLIWMPHLHCYRRACDLITGDNILLSNK